MFHKPPLQSVTQFQLSSMQPGGRKIDVTSIVVLKITCDLPMSPITYRMDWTHLSDLPLADPGFAQPGRTDILLEADIYVDMLRHGQWDGPPNSPTAFETDLGWVLCGSTGSASPSPQANVHVTAFHASVMSSDDVFRKFWELEEAPSEQACQLAEERMVVHHFDSNHSRTKEGRFIVPLPKDQDAKPTGESRSQAVRRFLSLERSMKQKGCFPEFDAVMREYFDLGHAEPVPTQDMNKPTELTFYLPMHAVYKTSSTTTKIRAVFDASAKSSTGVSLNDTLLVGPSLHPTLVDVLLQFRLYPVALTADISKMYWAVELTESDKDLHRFTGNPRRFKTYVRNRISYIIDQLPPDSWRHVAGTENPADCALRGLFPQQLKDHDLWWKGPRWLRLNSSHWPTQSNSLSETVPEEEREICHLTTTAPIDLIIPITRYSSFGKLKRVTAWIFRFVKNLGSPVSQRCLSPHLFVTELSSAESYWLTVIQRENFPNEYNALKNDQPISRSSRLLSFRPIWDRDHSLICVGGRLNNSSLSYTQRHPVILDGKHLITKLIILSEHLRLMHAGPTLLLSSLGQRFHIIKARRVVRSITRQCIICKRHSIHPQAQLLGQLPTERVSVAAPFERTGVDYVGPFQLKYGHVRKPTIIKAYICLFVCLTIKAVHLEVVSDLTTEAFIATLRRFIARQGCPALIWSDHGSNFAGAKSELKELQSFLADPNTQGSVSDFCSENNIQWKFIPERAPHFGGIWESAVKSVKTHLKHIVSPVRLTFEEFTTVLSQIEACLNSCPLTSMNSPDDDGVTALTPGHFLIGKPLTAIPDSQISHRSISLLKHWHLCQQLVRHFWERWHNEYLYTLNRYNKWYFPSRNVTVGDVVILQETGTIPTKWPIARVIAVHPGSDKLVRVVTVKTPQGTYKRPVSKVAVLLPNENDTN